MSRYSLSGTGGSPNCKPSPSDERYYEQHQREELTTLRKENARLREAFEKIIGLTYDPNYTSNGHEYGIAKQALTKEE